MSAPEETDMGAVMLTPKELADQLGESVDELARLRRKGQGPEYVALSRRTIRYLVDDVDEWLVEQGIRHRQSA
jgi:predicted DNA-binding transcriptional regulator AlpA